MLRFVFWSLLFLNAALFAYAQGFMGTSKGSEEERARIKPQLEVARLTLLTNEQAEAAKTAPAAAAASAPAATSAAAAAAPEPAMPTGEMVLRIWGANCAWIWLMRASTPAIPDGAVIRPPTS